MFDSDKFGLKCEYYVTYSGVGLPLKLVSPIDENDLYLRNTYFRQYTNDQNQKIIIEKIVHGRVEMVHKYTYDQENRVIEVEITDTDEEPKKIQLNQ